MERKHLTLRGNSRLQVGLGFQAKLDLLAEFDQQVGTLALQDCLDEPLRPKTFHNLEQKGPVLSFADIPLQQAAHGQ
ncbi:hypothetical protein B7486_03660 [cyanobacterium TDX16]|nr:hypothetical protein B7486_03660 [cyanobacterium TDX16]